MCTCWKCGKKDGDSLKLSFSLIQFLTNLVWEDIIRVKKCDKCGKEICQVCGKGGCPSCEALRREKEEKERLKQEKERRKKEEERLKIVKRMRVYSINYEGKIPVNSNQPYQEIRLEDYRGDINNYCYYFDSDHEDGWFRSKEDALEALKYIVSNKGFDLIYKLQYLCDTYEEETDSGGTYYYKVWSCECIAGHQKVFSKK